MGMKRKIVSLLLCLVMALSLVPTAAFAADTAYLPELQNVKLSSDGVLTFDPFITTETSQVIYDYTINRTKPTVVSGGSQRTTTSFNVKEYIDNRGWGEGTYEVSVIARTGYAYEGGRDITKKWTGSYLYYSDSDKELGVWVNGQQFTMSNAATGIPCGYGKATLDTTTSPFTVVLDNATINYEYAWNDGAVTYFSGIFGNSFAPNGVANINIKVKGNCTINVSSKSGANESNCGIFFNGSVNILGDGSLTVNVGGSSKDAYGICAPKVSVRDVTLAVDSAGYAVGLNYLNSPVSFDNAEVTLRGARGVCTDDNQVTFNGYAPKKISVSSSTSGSGAVAWNGDADLYNYKYLHASTAYNVWVNGEQFTSNKLTIPCGSGTATYDPATNTVTLNNAQITKAYRDGAIEAKGALTVNVAGDSSITLDSSTDAHGIFAEGNLTLTGTGNLGIQVDADECDGIEVWNDATISGSGDVTIRSECYGVYSVMGKLILSGSGNVDIYGEGAGCYGENMQVLLNGTGSSVKLGGGYKSVNNDDGASIVAGANFDKYEATGDPASTSVTYMYKVAIPYGVWVNGEQFTSKQLTIPCGTGTATYDPDTNTVTLNNATITKAYNDGTQSSGIYASDALTVKLVGENKINPTGGTWSAIYADKDIAIIGDGTLNVSTLVSYTSGIKSKTGNVTISVDDTAKITMMVMLDGIFSGMNTIISGDGTVNVTSNEATGILSNGGVTIDGSGNVAFSGHSRGIASYSGNVTISGSGDVSIAGNAGSDGIYLGQGDLILSGSGKKVYIAGSIGTTAAAVRFGPENEGQVLLNGTASPITLKGAKEAVTYHGASPVAGTNFNKYNADGDPASTSVVYTYTGICTHPNTELHGFVAPTCTAEGCSGDIYCKDCGMQLAASKPMEKLEHDYEQTATYDPTCTEDGYGEMTCKYCGDKFTFKMYDAFNHPAYETIPGKAATCTETGLTEGKKCVVCGEILEAQEIIPAKGHHYVGDTCDVCGYSKPSTTLLGDVNNDGRVNQKDVARLRQYIADGTTYPLDAQQNADVNKDGKINQKDVARLRQYIADPATYPLG